MGGLTVRRLQESALHSGEGTYMRIRYITTLITLAFFAAIGIASGPVASASPPPSGSYVSWGSTLRPCVWANAGCTATYLRYTTSAEDKVSMRCWFDGDAQGDPTKRWFWVTDIDTRGFA